MADDKQADSKGGMQVDTALLRELAQLITDTDLTEIEVEDGHRKIRVARTLTMAAAPVSYAAPAAPPAVAAVTVAAAEAPAADAVRSPMVGTAYLQPEPGAPQYKSVGDSVKEGETVLIIEAMKVMNAIPAPRAGTITGLLITSGQPVEFDQPLFTIA